MGLRCALLAALLVLGACTEQESSGTSEAQFAPESVPEVQAAATDSAEAFGSGEVDESDTSWMDALNEQLEQQLPDVWHGEDPPLRVETRHFMHEMTGLRDHYLVIRAYDDVLELRGLVLNRGNCPYSETGQVINGVDWPQVLRFGQRKQVRAKCDRVIEAVVSTQYGDWTFTFD
ncbi:hypothetical protein [Comamonas kerstersii]|uniref:hypothetical protein n=1 Tax=Comamonas kerstersii TaxID=225992 RepID=UPI00266C5525|nr:hypothetical protein [Comamonas kerstersii]